MTQQVKNLPAIQELQVRFPGWKDPLEGGMATHSSTPAWKIWWTEAHGGTATEVQRAGQHCPHGAGCVEVTC